MGRIYDRIDDRLRDFLCRQPVFFVGTAPLDAGGTVNVSPKGLQGTFAVLGPHQVAYLDLTGSGIETVAHLRENGRITLMFCAFDDPPRIVRLSGRGEAVVPEDDRFADLAALFTVVEGVRSVIVVDVTRIADSCGYGVPLMEYVDDRPQRRAWLDKKGADGVRDYVREKNATSIDGLPAVPIDPRTSHQDRASSPADTD